MMDYQMLYQFVNERLLSREKELFGSGGGLDFDAFSSCAVGNEMPILYFEVPLLGKPRFDLQVCINRQNLGNYKLPPTAPKSVKAGLYWLANNGEGCVGLDFAFDVSEGDIHTPQVIAFTNGCRTCDLDSFFACVGDAGAAKRYYDAEARVPSGWMSWYTGLIAQRPGRPVRLDYFVDQEKILLYRHDLLAFEKDLRQMGYEVSGRELELCQELMEFPFGINLQFDLYEDGTLGPVLGYNAAFGQLGPHESRQSLKDGDLALLMKQVQDLELADERWQLMQTCCIGQAYPVTDGSRLVISSSPTFLKVRMTPDRNLDAKAYIICRVKNI